MADRDDQLRDEYFKLQDQYEDYDRRALQIKGWIGAGSLAAFAIGLDPGNSAGGLIWLIIAIMCSCFWYLEAKWKLFQYALADRIRILEAHFRADPDVMVKDPEPFQIYSWWFRSYVKDEPIFLYEKERGYRPRSRAQRLLGAARQSFVHLPYSLIIGLSIALYVFQLLGAGKPS
ncbi:MAG: hypothetical protein KDB14_18695 [Planctomycetales bacterium]|nr:hypothetical protein [Planctomycetales bacterium]